MKKNVVTISNKSNNKNAYTTKYIIEKCDCNGRYELLIHNQLLRDYLLHNADMYSI